MKVGEYDVPGTRATTTPEHADGTGRNLATPGSGSADENVFAQRDSQVEVANRK